MFKWETHGIQPVVCSEPISLQRYMQGKMSRDWHVTEWRRGVSEGLFVAEEFFGSLGLRTAKEFKSIFGREPKAYLLQRQSLEIGMQLSNLDAIH
jgi:hypothetical protein